MSCPQNGTGVLKGLIGTMHKTQNTEQKKTQNRDDERMVARAQAALSVVQSVFSGGTRNETIRQKKRKEKKGGQRKKM